MVAATKQNRTSHILWCGTAPVLLLLLLAMPSAVESLVNPAHYRSSTVYTTGVRARSPFFASVSGTTASGAGVCCNSSSRSSSCSSSSSISMRDRSSSYWFSVGDTVRVVEDVPYSGGGSIGGINGSGNGDGNLKGRIGTVVETWEKCDVDPTCCCAEQVDTDMAVRVAFAPESASIGGDDDAGEEEKESESLFYYYFAEEELVRWES